MRPVRRLSRPLERPEAGECADAALRGGGGWGARLAAPAPTLRAGAVDDLRCLWLSRESRANFGAGNVSGEAPATALALLFPGVVLAPGARRGGLELREASLSFPAPFAFHSSAPKHHAPGPCLGFINNNKCRGSCPVSPALPSLALSRCHRGEGFWAWLLNCGGCLCTIPKN